ncbi:MAG: YdcF family protein [Oxalobacteraceae bacterium]|nr:YdcF family protein [Oxalobacteraceae bacterium]
MNPHWLITNWLAALILPPMGLILLAGVGWLMARQWLYLGRAVIALAVMMLIGLSTEAGANWLARPLEQQAVTAKHTGKPQAIVILGAGRMRLGLAPEAPDQVGLYTLMRLRTGAELHRDTRLPILVTGGAPDRPGEPEGLLMARSLKRDFAVQAQWTDDQAANTAENALLASRILRTHQLTRVWLVTDAVHMPRAMMAFERAGIEVIPAPSTFIAAGTLSLASFIPTAQALRHSHYALHEWLGLLWYQISLGAVV